MWKKPLPLRIMVIFIVLLLWSGQASASRQAQKPRRDPQVLRELIEQGSPERRLLADETKTIAPGGPSSPGGYSPSWSAMILQTYRTKKNWSFFILDPAGKETRFYPGPGTSAYPAFQKNGQGLAYANELGGNIDVVTKSFTSGEIRRLTSDSVPDSLPKWSPDGSRIAFQSFRTGSTDVYVVNADGSGLTALGSSAAYDGEPAWSPDGRHIAFVSNRSGRYELWVMDSNGAAPRQLTSGATAATPDWSPKDDRIAFANDSDRDGFFEMWVVDSDGKNLQPLDFRISNDRDVWAPAWSPDGEVLAAIVTAWVQYKGNWYWTESSIVALEMNPMGGFIYPSSDRLVWRVDWAAVDGLPPAPCTVIPAAQRLSEELPVRFQAQDQGPSGLMAYDGQFREPGQSWKDFAAWIRSDGAIYSGAGSGQVELRCRAYDWAGNAGPWSSAPALSPVFDAIRPVSRAMVSQRMVKGNQVTVSWRGQDPGSGIASYDIFSRDGDHADWMPWLSGVVTDHAAFTGQIGRMVSFRSQARDAAGHTQAWRPLPQASVSFYASLLRLSVTGARDEPLPSSSIQLSPAPLFGPEEKTPGDFSLYLGSVATHTLQVASPGFSAAAPAEIPTPDDTAFLWVLTATDEKTANGGFEAPTLSGWSVTGLGASLANERHTGDHALQLSQASPTATTVSQTVLLPPSIQHPTLSLFYRIPSAIQGGSFEVQAAGSTQLTVLSVASSSGGWQHAWGDLSAMAGQQITLTLKLSGAGTAWVDEVSVAPWTPPPPPPSTPQRVFLPSLSYDLPGEIASRADWTMYGYDNARSGYQRGEPGASRYSLAWTVDDPGLFCYDSPPVVVADGILLAQAGCQATLRAYDAHTGVRLWVLSNPNPGGGFTPVVRNGRVYLTHQEAVSIDLYSGKTIWSTPGSTHYNPLVAEHRLYGSLQNAYYGARVTSAMNASSGSGDWSRRIDYLDDNDWAAAYDRGVLYRWVHGILQAREAGTGSVEWELKLHYDDTTLNAMPVVAGSLVLVNTAIPEKIIAVDQTTQQVRWTIDTSSLADSLAPFVAVADGEVVSTSGELQVFDLSSGTLKWSFTGDGYLRRNPIVTQNYIYVSSHNNTYVLDRKTHGLVWQTNHGGWLAVANGFLYIKTDAHEILAFRAQEP